MQITHSSNIHVNYEYNKYFALEQLMKICTVITMESRFLNQLFVHMHAGKISVRIVSRVVLVIT